MNDNKKVDNKKEEKDDKIKKKENILQEELESNLEGEGKQNYAAVLGCSITGC